MGTRAERTLSTRSPPLRGLGSRVSWAALALIGVLLPVAARVLPPSPSGVGTHRALGLPACGFLVWSGLPCPTCGMTTAFAHAARFELGHSLRAHPLGLPLFALLLLLVPCALWSLARGASIAGAVARTRADRIALWLALCLLACWVARVLALTR